MKSFYQHFGFPDALIVGIVTFCVILLLSPYMGGKDLGIFKIPTFRPRVKTILRWAGPILLFTAIFGFIPIATSPEKDPLDIEGTWTYTTYFNDNNDSKKHKYKAVKGVNVLITFDGCGYTMQGKRTHYEEKNSNTFQEYPNPILINISRTGFTPDHTKFYFYFEVGGIEEADRSEGFVEMQIDKSNKSKMEGDVHYLYNDGTWSKAHITFEKQ